MYENCIDSGSWFSTISVNGVSNKHVIYYRYITLVIILFKYNIQLSFRQTGRKLKIKKKKRERGEQKFILSFNVNDVHVSLVSKREGPHRSSTNTREPSIYVFLNEYTGGPQLITKLN